jgi:hypothetical protein
LGDKKILMRLMAHLGTDFMILATPTNVPVLSESQKYACGEENHFLFGAEQILSLPRRRRASVASLSSKFRRVKYPITRN